ncbi:MAG: hypothetical protein K6E78_08325 [Treponema sp.]|nr:hypothetical protein [Treponema sp.]
MLQFYFLSVLLNILVGLVLFFNDKEKSLSDDLTVLEDDEKSDNTSATKISLFKKFFGKGSYTDDEMFYLVLGCLSIFTAIIKLLSAVSGIAFLGDFIPALAGFVGGASVLIMYFQLRSTVSLEMNSTLEFILVESRKFVGIFCLAAGIIHFIVPGVLFL